MIVAAEHLVVPREGERASGDAVVARLEASWALCAVIDGLGHGEAAAAAARAAVRFLLDETPAGAPMSEGLMLGLHQSLRGTRGAAAMVCVIAGGRLDGCGVGNVELRAMDAKLPIVQSPGVLGSRVGGYRLFGSELPKRCRLVFHSDGIGRITAFDSLRQLDGRALCEALMNSYRKPADDASVLVCDVEA